MIRLCVLEWYNIKLEGKRENIHLKYVKHQKNKKQIRGNSLTFIHSSLQKGKEQNAFFTYTKTLFVERGSLLQKVNWKIAHKNLPLKVRVPLYTPDYMWTKKIEFFWVS